MQHRPQIGFIFQDFGLLPWLTVERNAGLGLEARKVPQEERAKKVSYILDELGIASWAKAYPVRLSGGMQQRVAVARALASDDELILMDEPFSSLDALTRESVQDMLRTIQQRHHTTIILVTHSIEEAVYLADDIVLFDGLKPVHQCLCIPNPHLWEKEFHAPFNAETIAGPQFSAQKPAIASSPFEHPHLEGLSTESSTVSATPRERLIFGSSRQFAPCFYYRSSTRKASRN